MKTRLGFIVISAVLLLFADIQVSAGDKVENQAFCRLGKIIAVHMNDRDPGIINISKYEPPSKITENVGYAEVTLMLDRGRSIGIYDYTLIDKQGNKYPCIAIKEGNGKFDASKWRIEHPDHKKKYTLIFKVQKPSGPLLFNLHYNFAVKSSKDIVLNFSGGKNFIEAVEISQKK